MTQKVISAPQLHADHRHWKNDISMWQDDIEQWRSQHATAQETLEQIASMIADHAKSLEEHADKLQALVNGLEYHEQILSESLRGGSDADLDDSLLERHEEQASTITNQRDAHERIKTHHHIAMAHVATLKAALEAAM